mgnify:CR=1 FL=1
MGKKARIKAVVKYARKERDKALRKKPAQAPALNYRWRHTLRVAQRGMHLAEQEGADLEIVTAACMLHDIAKLSNKEQGVEHGRVGAKMVRPILQKLGFKKKKIDPICYAIARHVDGKAGYKYPHTLEADVVSDADKIDRFSAYRTTLKLRSRAKSHRNYLRMVERQLSHLKKLRKKPPTRTESGTRIFREQLDLQIAFLETVLADDELTTVPKL